MARVSSEVDKDNDLTVFKVTGFLKPEVMFGHLDSPDRDEPTSRNLFDFTEASWAAIPLDEFSEGVRQAKKFSRPGAKSAFVFSRDADLELGKYLEHLSQREGYVSTIRAFQDMQSAREWLLE